MLKSKIISRRSTLQIYKMLIRPIETYGAETWALTVAEENVLRRFETRVMDNGVWRIRYNSELYKFMGEEDIVRFIKVQRIQWLGHVERMDEMAMPKRVLKGKLYAMRRTGRPRIRWMDDLNNIPRRMGIRRWMEKARNKEQWRLIIEEAKVHPGL